MRIATLISLLLLCSAPLLGQNTRILVKSKADSTCLPYAHVCVEHDKEKIYLASDGDGKAMVKLAKGSIISISSIGYATLIDTVYQPKASYTFWLDERNFTSNPIVITGQHKAIRKDKSIYNVKVIDNKQIERLAADNLGELLSHELNVRIHNDPSTGSSLELQGISGENIKILVDGVPLIGRLDGNLDLSQINLDQIDHIEIVEGPMSVSYGSNALGGVINIITKENRYAKFAYGLKSYNESVGQYNQSMNAQYRWNHHTVSIDGGRKFFGGYSLNDSVRSQTWKPKEQYHAGGYYLYAKNHLKIKNKLDFFNERLWNKGNLLAPYYERAYDTWFYTQRVNNQVHIQQRMDSVKAWELTSAYSFYQRKGLRYIKDLTSLENTLTDNPSDHDTTAFHSFIARGVFSRSHKDMAFSYQAGFDLNYETGIGKRLKNGRDEMGDFALFGSMQWKATDKLLLQPALRYAYNTKYASPLAPSFNLKYSIGKSIIRFSYARGFRAPSLKELNLYFFDSNHQIEGNENLKAERSHNFSAFYGYSGKLFGRPYEWQLKAYHNYIQDMIALVQVDPDNSLHYRNENIGEFRNLGSDLTLNYQASRFIKLQGGISYIGSKEAEYESEDYLFSLNGNAGLNWNFFKNRWSASVMYKYVGENPQYYINSNGDLELGRSESYHNMDANIGTRFVNNKYRVSVGVKNIFNNTTLSGLGSGGSHSGSYSSLVGWGRTYFLNFAYKFVKY